MEKVKKQYRVIIRILSLFTGSGEGEKKVEISSMSKPEIMLVDGRVISSYDVLLGMSE